MLKSGGKVGIQLKKTVVRYSKCSTSPTNVVIF